MDPNQLLAMIQQLLPSLAQGGQVGQTLTPAMQQAATASGAITPQDAASATVVGISPTAPNASPYSAMAGGNLAKIAQDLVQDPTRRPEIGARPANAGGGAGPAPIATPPFGRPPAPLQAAGAPPTSVGAFLASPAGQQIIKQMQAMRSGGINANG